jgi:hypothetical protein
MDCRGDREGGAHYSGHCVNDDDTTDTETEDDSGIAEEIESPTPPHQPPVKLTLPDLNITDTFAVQTNALNNFFNYW